MERLAIVATKGGVGKTTLAVHLAAAAQRAERRVLLIDLDPQGSAAQWGKDRAKLSQSHGAWFKTPLEVRRCFADDLENQLEAAEDEGFDFAIIDTPPHADFPAARAVEVADMVLVPTRPGYFDLHAAKATVTLIKSLGANGYFIINQVPHNSMRIVDDAVEFLKSKGLSPVPGFITLLQPYVRALRNGLTAPELTPDGRHAAEIGVLWEFIAAECKRARAGRKTPGVRKETERMVAQNSALLDDPFAEIIKSLQGDAA